MSNLITKFMDCPECDTNKFTREIVESIPYWVCDCCGFKERIFKRGSEESYSREMIFTKYMEIRDNVRVMQSFFRKYDHLLDESERLTYAKNLEDKTLRFERIYENPNRMYYIGNESIKTFRSSWFDFEDFVNKCEEFINTELLRRVMGNDRN